MSELNPRIQRLLRELPDGPAPWFYEDLFALMDACVRFVATLERRIQAGACSAAASAADAAETRAEESP